MDYTHLFRGCRYLFGENGVYTPARFDAEQAQLLAGGFSDLLIRANCTAGVRLEFVTELSAISFSFRCDSFARPIVAFDVWENGQYRKTLSFPDNTSEGHFLYETEDPGSSHLCIFLPHLVRTTLSDVSLGDALPAPAARRTLLFYGDSITQGMTASRPSFTWASAVARSLNADWINFGIGGKKFHRNLLDQTAPIDASAVFVGFGTNDAMQADAPSLMRQNISGFFAALREYFPVIPVYVITAPSIEESLLTASSRPAFPVVRELTTEYAKRYQCFLIDGEELLPNDPSLFVDGVHPNEAGSAHYAAKLLSQIEQDFR